MTFQSNDLMMCVIFIKLLFHGVIMIWFFFTVVLKDRGWLRCTRILEVSGKLIGTSCLETRLLWTGFPVGYIWACASDQGHWRGQRSQLTRVWSWESTSGMLLARSGMTFVRWDRLWILYVRKRRYADGLIERMYGGFVWVNMDPSFHQRKLYQNLRGLGVLNAPERLQVELDVERLNNYFFTRPLLSWADEFAVSRTQNVPEFSFSTVSESEIYDAVMSVRSDAVGVDGIP
jgi:hypothetical protein